MKKILLVIKFLIFTTFINAQVIDWNNFDERKMDTVMFEVMGSYLDYMGKDPIVWSPVVQREVMGSNYEIIKANPHLDIHSLHNKMWPGPMGLPAEIKERIIDENINPTFLEGQKYFYKIDKEGHTAEAYGTFDYTEILVSIPRNEFTTYQELANHAIHSWNRSGPHSGIMNANYKKKVIVGTITFYHKPTQRVFISFVYIS